MSPMGHVLQHGIEMGKGQQAVEVGVGGLLADPCPDVGASSKGPDVQQMMCLSRL